jgi:hypothetical protein
MGAWGSGSFENDTAMDWVASVRSLADVHGPFDRLKALGEVGEPGPIDADLASEVVAAAETVAMLMGRTIPGFPGDLRKRLADAGEPDNFLYHRARDALLQVLRNSELALLWEEGAAENDINAWNVEITALFDRLNPDIEPVPWTPEEIEQKAGGPVGRCAFCDGPIDASNLVAMSLFDCTNMMGFNATLWLHLPCLNARLHHKHAIVDLKFDPDNMPDLDSL